MTVLIEPGPNPWGELTRPFKRGDRAWPVLSAQIALNRFGNRLALDGDFGPATEKVARAFQVHRGMRVDGVIGPVSQERICIDLSTSAARRYQLPVGLARGLIENESSFALAAFTEHPSDTGFDLGAWQDSYASPGSQDEYRASLDVSVMAYRTCEKLRLRYDAYRSAGAPSRLAWECATLYHNWPAAADRMAKGLAPLRTGSDEEAAWVVAASGGRLRTPREWADAYIAAATKRVLEW